MIKRTPSLPISSGFFARLTTIAVALAAVLVAVGAAALYLSQTRDSNAELKRQAQLIGALIIESVHSDFEQGDLIGARETMRHVVASGPGVVAVKLLGRQHEPLLTYGELPPGRRFESAEVPVHEPGELTSPDDRTPPTGYAQIFIAARPWGPAEVQRYVSDLSVLALISLLFVGAAFWVTRHIASPIRQVEVELQSTAIFASADAAPPNRSDGLGAMAEAVANLGRRMQVVKEEQEIAIESRIRELQATVASATRSNEERKRLIAYVDGAVEAERKRIAGEIHDTVGSVLVSLRLRAEAIATRAAESGQDDIREIADRIVRTTAQLYDSTRSIVQMLRPELLESLGLSGAIGEMVRRLDESQQACRFEYHVQPATVPVEGIIAMTAYRVAQEACTNVLKHANAHHVRISLSNAEPPRQVRLVIADDGKGLHAGDRIEGSGLGLIAMRERVEASGGILSVNSDGSGTTITVAL